MPSTAASVSADASRSCARRGDGKSKVLHDDHAGTLETVDPSLVRLLLQNGYTPVLTPPALGEEGVPINVDGDKLALELATALKADGLLFFSDTPGLRS